MPVPTRDGRAGEANGVASGDSELGHFLATRRARVTPREAGVAESGRRRVPGLRREEVAALANISTDYYVQIERGRARGVSEDVLRAIAVALQLDTIETAHLFDLAGLKPPPLGSPEVAPTISPVIAAMIAAIDDVPVVVQNNRLDIVTANPLGYALYAPVIDRAEGVPNLARYVFGDAHARSYYMDRDDMARHVVALLRFALARPGASGAVSDLVRELSLGDEFRDLWSRHDVEIHRSGVKRVRHPIAGELRLRYEGLDVPSLPGSTLYCYQGDGVEESGAFERLRCYASARQANADEYSEQRVYETPHR